MSKNTDLSQRSQSRKSLYSTRRVEALTDGVFAIAMTLLVLDLAVPTINGTTTNQSLWQALVALGPNLLSFALSFIILGIMWAIHMRQFEHIDKVDHKLTSLNTLRLFVVVLIPFTTSLNGHYGSLLVGQIFYPINLFLLALVTYIQGNYVASRPDFYSIYNKSDVAAGQRRSLSFVIVSGIVCIATVFLGSMAFFGYLLVPISGIFLKQKPDKDS